jgi:hypothetical protein
MTQRTDDVDALARAIDLVVFAETDSAAGRESPSAASALVSYLNDTFPRLTVPAGRRDRLQQRIMRALGIPRTPTPSGWVRLEQEMNRRISSLDPKWTPVVGGAALVIIGVVGFAFWRQRTSAASAVR